MSRFPDRNGKALLVIDVQNDVVAEAHRRAEVIGNINTLVAKARDAEIPVIWVQHSDDYMEIGSDAWQIVSELRPMTNEPLIRKKFRSSFEETTLDETLAKLGVGHLVISGAQTDYCVRHTSHAALERGYDVTLVEDAHTTSDGQWDSGPLLASSIIDEMNRSFQEYELPGRSANITPTAEIAF
ncbi:MAG TPA: cysteine hydrolase family protein [Candidatus Nanopelagicaceae bacterium]|jgi:nicotinamidase-related amidase